MVFFFDNADIIGDEDARFENIVATHLLKRLHFIEDHEGHHCELRYLRDKERREVDFVILKDGEIHALVEAKKGEAGGRELDLLLHRARIEIIPFNGDQVELALTAWRKFGKGNHPAGLNIGGCCAYALTKTSGEPLLFKDKDFTRTDIRPVIDM